MQQQPILNEHNKAEFEPAHTAEHILNATMVKMFGCPRSRNAHVEKKKSKCDYLLDAEPSAEQVAAIETAVNEVISQNLEVTVEFMSREQAAGIVDLSKLPEDASQTLRIVRIGDYDACACIGAHVGRTGEVGTFRIISHSFADGVWRLRWKVVATLAARSSNAQLVSSASPLRCSRLRSPKHSISSSKCFGDYLWSI